MQHHCCCHFLPQCGMLEAEGYWFRHCWMVQQNLVDLARPHVLAPTNDQVLDPASQMQIVVFVEKSLITGAKPSIHKRTTIGFVIILISLEHTWPLNHNFAPLI